MILLTPRLNRTIVGLKVQKIHISTMSELCLNRTIVGLKELEIPFIAPLSLRLNRTIVGLKANLQKSTE